MVSFRLPFFPPSRAVIVMMDDGVSVYKSSIHTEFLDFISWGTRDLGSRLKDVIDDSGVASVLILNDAVEQHYRKEKINIPTSFDRTNIIKRRLNVAFPNYPMRAALELAKAKNAKSLESLEDIKEKHKLFLFAASPSTESFSRILDVVRDTDCNLFGYGLLPLESASLVKELNRKLQINRRELGLATWTIFVGQHRGGGLRQIVLRDSELALTRVTSIAEPSQGNGDVWAGDVANEIHTTLSYLSRFGYSPEDGMNIIVLGDLKYTDVIDGMITAPANFVSMSPVAASEMLGVKIDSQNSEHFADTLHAAWSGRKLSLVLPLSSREINDISNPRKVASILMVMSILGLGASLVFISDVAQGLYRNAQNIEVANSQLAEIEKIYQEEVKRKESLGIDINLIKGSIEIDRTLSNQKISVLNILSSISNSLKNIRMDSLEFVSASDGSQIVTPSEGIPIWRDVDIRIEFSFAGNVNPRDGNAEMDLLIERLNQKLKPMKYEAILDKPLEDLTYSGSVDREVGLVAKKRSASDKYVPVVVIKRLRNG